MLLTAYKASPLLPQQQRDFMQVRSGLLLLLSSMLWLSVCSLQRCTDLREMEAIWRVSPMITALTSRAAAVQYLMAFGLGARDDKGVGNEHTLIDVTQRLAPAPRDKVLQHARALVTLVETLLRSSRRPSIKEAPLLCNLEAAEVRCCARAVVLKTIQPLLSGQPLY